MIKQIFRPLAIAMVLMMALAIPGVSLAGCESADLSAINKKIFQCEKIDNIFRQKACLEKLSTKNDQELAQKENALGRAELQARTFVEKPGENLERALEHYRKACLLDPCNEENCEDYVRMKLILTEE